MPTSHSNAKTRKIIFILGIAVFIIVFTAVFGLIFLNTPRINQPTPFNYSLATSPIVGTISQGQNLQTNLTITYIEGEPQNVNLNVVGGPENCTCTFTSVTGSPRPRSPFESILEVTVPWSAPAGVYQLNITSTSEKGGTYTTPFTLTVTTATINVSGTVTADFNQDIYPTQISFISITTKQSFSTNVSTTPPVGEKSPSGMLVQTGRYSISLPNRDSYMVVCSWIRLGDLGRLRVQRHRETSADA